MTDIVLFGGTTEGRELAALLSKKGILALICVATEYGGSLTGSGGSVTVKTGQLCKEDMIKLFDVQTPRYVIDATHPYASEAGQNIRSACAECDLSYIRILREAVDTDGLKRFTDIDSMIHWLNSTDGIIFSSLGAKQAALLTGVSRFEQRVWLRILPQTEGLEACLSAGFPAEHIVCMQGPFSQQLNSAMFKAADACILLTKESGDAGGFPEKIAAANECGVDVAVLTRPCSEEGITLSEIKKRIEDNAL